ncbi:hypothetical protein ccbrp13_53240 [Ktedonobacteria bacterium brp13]|nr:hypothetical protein ccbrp13_53240 [Ktedonobacteria bacterium brp13]
MQQPPPARLTYVAIGASDTFGIGSNDPLTQSWPVDLAHKLGTGVRLINLGVPGIDAPTALQMELPVVLDTHPNIITVWLAVNDLVDKVPVAEYQRDLDQLLARLYSAAPRARILVANIPDLSLVPRFQKSNLHVLHAEIDSYNQAISVDVAREHVMLVDLTHLWQTLADHPEYISDDGFHPSTQGYAQLAEVFYQALS